MQLPAEFHRLFWDVRPEAIDPEAHTAFILERLLEYGSLAAVRWALRAYGREGLADFLRGRGHRTLSRKTLCFWTLILELEGRACFETSSLQSSRSFWDY